MGKSGGPKLKAALKKYLNQAAVEKKKKKGEKLKIEAQKAHREHINSILHNKFTWSDNLVTCIPFRPDASVLIVGDGDFSFSVALSALLSNNAKLICTVYDTPDQFAAKYPSVNTNHLSARPNVSSVLYSRDCRQPFPSENIDVVVFNFPHTGSGLKDRDRNIRGNQELLQGFFSSCAKAAAKNCDGDATFVASRQTDRIKEASEQGKNTTENLAQPDCPDTHRKQTFTVIVTMWQGDPYDDWKLKKLAKMSGFTCTSSCPFAFGEYPGYNHVRTDGGCGNEFAARPARMHIFNLLGDTKSKPKKKKNKGRESESDGE